MSVGDKSFKRFPIPAAHAENPYCTKLLVRRSRFLAQTCHCESAGEAREFVAATRMRNPDATHNCWAFVAGAPGDTASIGSADDGEPHGTAGRPMLNALLHSGIGQICVVVSRWFGGIKLGTGGLARAYQDAVLQNLDSLPLVQSVDRVRCNIVLDYAHIEGMRRIAGQHEARISGEEYADRAEFAIFVPEDRMADFCAAVAELSNGSAIIRQQGRIK